MVKNKILIVSNKPPHPKIDGGCVAMANFYELLEYAGFEIFYICISTPKHPFIKEKFPSKFRLNDNLYHFYIDTNVKFKNVFQFLFRFNSLRVSRFESNELKNLISRIVIENKIDVIIYESIYAAINLISASTNQYIRTHNVENQIWENSLAEKNGIAKIIHRIENRRLKEFELNTLKKVNGTIAISELDKYYFEQAGIQNIETIPVFWEHQQFVEKPNKPLKLFHLAAMNWQPNVDALDYFFNFIYPAVNQLPIEFYFAGIDMPSKFIEKQNYKLHIQGKVSNAKSYIASKDVCVVPLRSGSGIRIKILEAMSLGKPVIATDVALKGINAVHKKNILLANTVKEWKEAIEYLMQDDNYYEIQKNALTFIEENYSKEVLKTRIINYLCH